MSLRVRIVLVAVGLLLLPVHSAVASDGEVGFRISVSPSSGPPGTPITVTGQGARVGLSVQVLLAADGQTGEGALAVIQVNPDANGNFTAVVTVPADTPAGRYAVRAEQRDIQGMGLVFWWAGFTVSTTAILMPTTGGVPEASSGLAVTLAALLVGVMAFRGVQQALRHP